MKTDAPTKRIYGWIAKLDECPAALISTAADRWELTDREAAT